MMPGYIFTTAILEHEDMRMMRNFPVTGLRRLFGSPTAETAWRSVTNPRVQFRQVDAKRTFHSRTHEVARTEFALRQHALDFRLRFLATRTLMFRQRQ
jgi:hypothetical protein